MVWEVGMYAQVLKDSTMAIAEYISISICDLSLTH